MRKQHALAALDALAQETRLDVFRLLVRAGPEGLPAGTIAERLDVKPNTLSTHLGLLSRAGLVQGLRSGRVIRYTADYDGMRVLLTYLLEDCCQGEHAKCAPVLDAIACGC